LSWFPPLCSLAAISNWAISGNSPWDGGAVYAYLGAITDCIIFGNGDDFYDCSVTYCCIEDNDAGEGNIHRNPMLVVGPLGNHYLSPDSPCIDAGSSSAAEAGLSARTTRADGALDTGIVDMGFHYPIPAQ